MSELHLAIINVVGLSESLLGEHTPNINRYIERHTKAYLEGVFPAVTTTVQSSILTGSYPCAHGIVGNGWYDRDFAEVMFWKQNNSLVQGEKLWDALKKKDPSFRVSKLFWWYNMYANVDASITPRPHYPADGRKIIDLYSTPAGLHQAIEEKIGKFPFFNFWGPKAGIQASEWIMQAAKIEYVLHQPNLQLVYLPHLDYCLQKFGPRHASIADELRAIDNVVGELLDFYESRNVKVILLSEYGIGAVNRAVHINRILREHGYIAVRNSLSWELLDTGASKAFAVADHQIAHIYINDLAQKQQIKRLLESVPGIERVLDQTEMQTEKIDHQRAGDLIAVAEKDAWFTYYYWLEDRFAPDFARTVDIHRKPGFDPVEMFIDPKLSFPFLKVLWRLLQKKLGFRMLMDVIPLDANLVRGSHGRLPDTPEEGALIVLPKTIANEQQTIKMTDLKSLILDFFWQEKL